MAGLKTINEEKDDTRLAQSSLAMPGESVCGDMVFSARLEEGYLLAVADGLGHGPSAHQISQSIADYLELHPSSDLLALLGAIDQHISPCDGAAIALAFVHTIKAELYFAGIGNIWACLIGQQDQSLVTRDGMVGANMRSPMLQTIPLHPGDKFIMASDGIMSRFYTRLDRRTLMASPRDLLDHLFKHYRKNDDASVLIFRY